MSHSSGNFRQLRITVTHELPGRFSKSGRFSVAIFAKPLNVPWREQDCVDRFACWAPTMPLGTYEEVLLALVDIIESTMLPHLVTRPTE